MLVTAWNGQNSAKDCNPPPLILRQQCHFVQWTWTPLQDEEYDSNTCQFTMDDGTITTWWCGQTLLYSRHISVGVARRQVTPPFCNILKQVTKQKTSTQNPLMKPDQALTLKRPRMEKLHQNSEGRMHRAATSVPGCVWTESSAWHWLQTLLRMWRSSAK